MTTRRPVRASARNPLASRFTQLMTMAGIGLILCFGFMADSCSSSVTQQSIDQQNSDAQAQALHKKYPYPTSKTSNELANLTERYKRLNDPNHVSYVYLLATGTGDIIAEYQVIGKCSSTESLYAAPESILTPQNSDGSHIGVVTVPAPQPDGSYGQNEQAIFCFIDDANKTLIEFNTQYIWTDNPLPLTSPPQIVIVPNGK